jgi:hypothetical protein
MDIKNKFLTKVNELGQHEDNTKITDTIRIKTAIKICEEIVGQLEPKVIRRLREIRDALTQARNSKCTCSFVIQYEQGCQCDKQKKIDACEKALWDEINAL